MTRYPTKKMSELKHGDIIYTSILFEENQSDYYHGHKVRDVIHDLVADKYGNTAKYRPAIFLGRGENDDIYLATMSSKSAGHDSEHQLQLQDTEGLPGNGPSYIEVSNMKRQRYKPEYDIPVIREINPDDLERLHQNYYSNLMSDRHHQTWKDAHIYAPDKEAYYKHLETEGYVRNEQGYTKGNHTVIENGEFLTSHFDVSLEDTLRKHHPNASLTFRSGERRGRLAPEIDLLLDDVKAMSPNVRLTPAYLPNGLDAKTERHGRNIVVSAATNHGAISELGKIALHLNKENPNQVEQFTAWYKEQVGLPNDKPVTKDFSHLGLTLPLTDNDLDLDLGNELQL